MGKLAEWKREIRDTVKNGVVKKKRFDDLLSKNLEKSTNVSKSFDRKIANMIIKRELLSKVTFIWGYDESFCGVSDVYATLALQKTKAAERAFKELYWICEQARLFYDETKIHVPGNIVEFYGDMRIFPTYSNLQRCQKIELFFVGKMKSIENFTKKHGITFAANKTFLKAQLRGLAAREKELLRSRATVKELLDLLS